MRKQGLIVVIATLMAVILCGAASAADSSTTGGENGLPEAGSSDEQDSDSPTVVDPIINVQVNYEYATDKINPDITVTDSNNNSMAYDKVNLTNNWYVLNFTSPGVANGTKFKITVTAPGYVTQNQEVEVNQVGADYVGFITMTMNATKNYKLGREVTAKANQKLNFGTADKVLAITTAGVPKLNGVTSEDCIEGILNGSNGKITYGKGNLLMLRQTAVEPVNFAFIVKRNGQLQMIYFKNGTSTPVYQGTISQNMSAKQWNALIKAIGGENAFSYASLANAWNAGAPADLLREAAFHGHMCLGSMGGYSITKALMKYYPPIQATLTGSGSLGDVTSYKVLGSPGDSDDDAVMYFLDTTPGKGSGYTGFDTSSTGASNSMIGFIRWNANKLTGDLIVLRFKRQELRQEFGSIKNDLDELKFNSWLMNFIKNDPGHLVEFIAEKQINEVQYYYLMGTATDVKNGDGTVRIPAQESHGLDMNYIQSIGTAATPNPSTSTTGMLTYDQMKQIGIDAAKLAKKIFKDDLGIDLEKDNRNLAVETSAGYVYLNGQTTEATWDGIFQELGTRLSRSTLLPIHTGVWKPLIYTFVLRGADGVTMNTIYMRYNATSATTGHWVVKNGSDGKKINDMGPVAINNATNNKNLNDNVFEDGNYFNYRTIANAWRVDPPFDQLMTFLFHDHACPGVQPGFFLSDYVLKNLPLGPNESYSYMGSTIYCKDDALIYLLGISPGMGSYMNQRLLSSETASELINGGSEEGVFVIWDSVLKVGRVYIANYKGPDISMAGLTTDEAKAEARIASSIRLYNQISDPRVTSDPTIVFTPAKLINEQEYNLIMQGGTPTTSSLQFVKDLPTRTLSDLIPEQGGSNTGGQTETSTGSTGSSTGSGSSGNGIYSSGSVGETGVSVDAASQTTATPAAGNSGKSYEVTEAATTGSDNTPWGTYAVVGILSVMALAGVGFFFKGSLFGR